MTGFILKEYINFDWILASITQNLLSSNEE